MIFTFISLQNILGYFYQIRQYQKMIRKWLGKGILGVGQRRGLFLPGEIVVFVYNPREDAAITVQSMRGFSIFARFKEVLDCAGLSLEELRNRGLEADRHDLRLWRLFFRYKPDKGSKRKGALIQAVEAVEKYAAEKYTAEKNEDDIKKSVITMPPEAEKTDTGSVAGLSGFNWTETQGEPEKEDVGKENV